MKGEAMEERIVIGTDGSGSLDDAIGAARESHATMTRILGNRGGYVHQPPDTTAEFPGVLGQWRATLLERLRTGETGICEHLAANPKLPMLWFVYIPDLIRCPDCTRKAAEAIYGTPEDDICDSCGVKVDGPNIHTVSGEISAQVRKGRTIGALIIHGGICGPCHEIHLAETLQTWGPGKRVEKRERGPSPDPTQ